MYEWTSWTGSEAVLKITLRNPQAVGRRLRALRQRRMRQALPASRYMWTIRGVAARLGVNPGTLSRLESGHFSSTTLIPALADLYGVSIEYILTGTHEKERNARIKRIVDAIEELNSMDLALLEAVIAQLKQANKEQAEQAS